MKLPLITVEQVDGGVAHVRADRIEAVGTWYHPRSSDPHTSIKLFAGSSVFTAESIESVRLKIDAAMAEEVR